MKKLAYCKLYAKRAANEIEAKRARKTIPSPPNGRQQETRLGSNRKRLKLNAYNVVYLLCKMYWQ